MTADYHLVRRLSAALVATVVCGVLPVRALEVASGTMRVLLVDGAQYYKGTVTGVVSSAGRTFSSGGKLPLFSVELRRTDCFTNVIRRTAHDAAKMEATSSNGALQLVFSGFTNGLEKVVCRIDGNGGDGKLRWRIAVTPKNGLAVTEVAYPQIEMDCPLGGDGSDDRMVAGAKPWGVICNPAETLDCRKWAGIHADQPGNLFAQFCGYYDDAGGIYSATEDVRFHAKRLSLYRVARGARLEWRWRTWEEGTATPDYAVVTACFSGKDGEPASWYDAADLYRDWARKQFWCKTPLAEKTLAVPTRSPSQRTHSPPFSSTHWIHEE